MAQIRLKNATGSTSKIRQQVKLVVGSKTSFVNADYWDSGIIGTCAQSVPNGNSCLIDLLGSTSLASQPQIIISPYPPASPTSGLIWIEASIT